MYPAAMVLPPRPGDGHMQDQSHRGNGAQGLNAVIGVLQIPTKGGQWNSFCIKPTGAEGRSTNRLKGSPESDI